MATTWVHERCGCRTTDGTYGPDREERIDSTCAACRQMRIGQRIRFLRFGLPPHDGQSFDFREREYLDGVSVYEICYFKGVGPSGKAHRVARADLVGWHFDFLDRPAYSGTGVIVGWGPDGEPLVRIERYSRVRSHQLPKLINS